VAAGSAGQDDQQWAQPLATPRDDVLGDLIDERNGAFQTRAYDVIDGNQVRLD